MTSARPRWVLPVSAPRSRAAIERLAESFLRSFAPARLAHPAPLDVLAALDCHLPHHYGFRVIVSAELPARLPAVTQLAARAVVLRPELYAAAERGGCEARHTVMHEIGHVVTLHDQVQAQLTLRARAGVSTQRRAPRAELAAYEDPEWQADAFAAATLMPRGPAARVAHTHPPPQASRALARAFGVGEEAARRRLRVLSAKGWLGTPRAARSAEVALNGVSRQL